MIVFLDNDYHKIEGKDRENLGEDLCCGVDCGLFGLALWGTLADEPDTFE